MKIEKEQDWDSATPANWNVKPGLVITRDNKSVYLVAAWLLGIISIISLAGIIGLDFTGHDIPQALIALGSVSIASLGNLFTHK